MRLKTILKTAFFFFLAGGSSHAQTASPTAPRVSSHQSIVVSADLTPEEKEEGRLNDLYQPLYQLEMQHSCTNAIEKYRSIISEAQKSKFDRPRNKFIYMATRGIAGCDISSGNYEEAEALYQKCLDYGPGLSDSSYPIILSSIGVARLGQQNWKGAEEILQKSVVVFDQQIESAIHSDSEFMRTEHANNLRMSQDSVLNYLAAAYFRQDRSAEALDTLERAYTQATKFNAPAPVLNSIIESGRAIAISNVNLPASATWLLRAKSENQKK